MVHGPVLVCGPGVGNYCTKMPNTLYSSIQGGIKMTTCVIEVVKLYWPFLLPSVHGGVRDKKKWQDSFAQ